MLFFCISTMPILRLTTPVRVLIAVTAEFLTPRSSQKRFGVSRSSYFDFKKRYANSSPLPTKLVPGRPPKISEPFRPKLAALRAGTTKFLSTNSPPR